MKIKDKVILVNAGEIFPTIHRSNESFISVLLPMNKQESRLDGKDGLVGRITSILLHPIDFIPIYHVRSKEGDEIFVKEEALELVIDPRSGLNPNQRWEQGIDHDDRSEELYKAIAKIDYEENDDYFCWKSGGDGDNGESLMYLLDVYFEKLDKGQI